MTRQELISKELEFRLLMDKLADDENERYPIYDGINNIDQYLNAKYRIMFILKEPCDEPDGSGGGWKISDILNKGRYGRASKTFYPMIYVTYGILNDFCKWNDMPDVKDDFEGMNAYLYKIAHVNISKLPCLKPPRTKFSDIERAYELDKENDSIVLKQIDAYQPDIIIGCGIGNLLITDLGLFHPHGKVYWKSKKYPKIIYVGCYHPAQTVISTEGYFDYAINQIYDNLLTNELI
jgi:hypothetical protein